MTFEDFINGINVGETAFAKMKRKNPNAICYTTLHTSCGEYIFSDGEDLKESDITIERSYIIIKRLLNGKIQSIDTIAIDSIEAVSYSFVDVDIVEVFMEHVSSLLKEDAYSESEE